MVKKLKSLSEKQHASGARLFDSELAGTVRDSAQQIWLAGLGAFSKAQAEGGKVFDALVKEGVSLQRKTQSAAEERISDVTTKMSTMAGDVSAKAGQQWDKLESIFEERTARAMNKLGVPTNKDLDALAARVDALTAALKGRVKAAAKPAAKTPRKAPAKRAARKAG
jgi:poly(hydroxyalkanoate) granule-associated protein